jgi:hypothetical protein
MSTVALFVWRTAEPRIARVRETTWLWGRETVAGDSKGADGSMSVGALWGRVAALSACYAFRRSGPLLVR